MHADSTRQTPESLVYSKYAALYFSLQFKLRMEETVCGSYDSKSVPVAERIYPFPSTGAIVTETRVPLKSCLLFLSFTLLLSISLSIFHRRTTSSAAAGYPFLIQCASVPVARKILSCAPRWHRRAPRTAGENTMRKSASDFHARYRDHDATTVSEIGNCSRPSHRFHTILFKEPPREIGPSMRRYANRKSKKIYQLLQVSVHRDRQ